MRTVELDANRLRQYSQAPLREWSVKLGDPVDIALGTLFALLVLFVRRCAINRLERIYNDLACRETCQAFERMR